jgi:hypothetical protein
MIFENNLEIIINILIIVSGLTIGIIIGYLLFNQYQYKGPDSNQIAKEVYNDKKGKKYRWVPKVCVCPISYSMDKLKDVNYIDPNH